MALVLRTFPPPLVIYGVPPEIRLLYLKAEGREVLDLHRPPALPAQSLYCAQRVFGRAAGFHTLGSWKPRGTTSYLFRFFCGLFHGREFGPLVTRPVCVGRAWTEVPGPGVIWLKERYMEERAKKKKKALENRTGGGV